MSRINVLYLQELYGVQASGIRRKFMKISWMVGELSVLLRSNEYGPAAPGTWDRSGSGPPWGPLPGKSGGRCVRPPRDSCKRTCWRCRPGPDKYPPYKRMAHNVCETWLEFGPGRCARPD